MRYYQLQRQSDDRSASRTTVRLLESLMRLSESHAKIMHRQIVNIVDAVTAISILGLLSQSTSEHNVSMLGR